MLKLFKTWLILLSLVGSTSFAQLIESTTGNLINGPWNGAPASTVPPGGFSGGATPVFNTNTGTIQFGYTQRTVSQSIAINTALANAGTGIQVSGYMYSWNYYNQDMNRGTLTGNISLTSSSGAVLQSYNYPMPQTTGGWTSVSGTQQFASPYIPSSLGNLNVSFTGKDDRFWAGYYGPLVKDIDVRIKYGVDPCALNPAYSPSCSGFNAVVESKNLVPYPDAYAVFGGWVNNSYAINTAFEQAGSGLKIHGFKWGYQANANGPYCAFWLIVCFDERTPSVTTNVNITSNTGASLYSVSRTYTDSYNTTSYSYLFPESKQLASLGSFNFTATTNDTAYIGGMWSKAIYTPDICMRDPLSSPTCPGYFTALSSTTSTSTTTATPEPVAQTTTTTADSGSIATTNPTRIETTVQASQPIASTSSTSTTSSVASVSTTASPSPSREVSSSGLSIGLSVVARNQQREQALAMQTAQTAVAAAEQTAQQAAQDAISVAQTSSANSAVSSSSPAVRQIASNVRSEQTQATSISQAQTNTSVAMFQPPSTQARSNETRSVASITITEAASVSNNQQLNSFTTNTETVSSASVSSIYSLLPTAPLQQVQSQSGLTFNQEIREKTENFTFGSQSQTYSTGSELQILDSQRMLTDRSNPLYAVINERSIEVQSNQTMQQRSSVNTNAANNEVAGGVDLTRMAVIPSGYNQYLNLVIADAAFYAPKEVYKNQRNVDNVRALRQMSSDRLHQEMVNQQYRR